jgi:hypothetical protein
VREGLGVELLMEWNRGAWERGAWGDELWGLLDDDRVVGVLFKRLVEVDGAVGAYHEGLSMCDGRRGEWQRYAPRGEEGGGEVNLCHSETAATGGMKLDIHDGLEEESC